MFHWAKQVTRPCLTLRGLGYESPRSGSDGSHLLEHKEDAVGEPLGAVDLCGADAPYRVE